MEIRLTIIINSAYSCNVLQMMLCTSLEEAFDQHWKLLKTDCYARKTLFHYKLSKYRYTYHKDKTAVRPLSL